MLFCTLGNLIPGLSYEHQVSDLALKFSHPFIVPAVLVIASGDEKSGTRHGSQGLDSCIRVGSLGVVVIPDPGALPDELYPVFHGMECLNDPCNVRHWNAHFQGNGCGCHDILIVMAAQELHIMDIDHNGLAAVLAVHNVIPVHAETILQLLPAGKPDDPGLKLRILAELPENRVAVVEHHRILLCLVQGNAFLNPDVILHGAVAVQMVRGDVQDCADIGSEIHNGFQLEAGHLCHGHGILRHLQHLGGIGVANVSHHKRLLIAGL